tara:strand:+ start:767 stop:1219 length:453 start_codon:yes stop_codon:yes gene_type:complete
MFNFLRNDAMMYGEDGDVNRVMFDHDPIPLAAGLLSEFTTHRPVGNMGKFIHYAVTKADFLHDRHYDADFKIMSAVLYLGPEKNGGTVLYDGDEAVIEVEWKPNKLFVFCGMDNLTWHHYYSEATRYTLNYFLVDMDKVENDEYRQKIIV